MAKRKRGSSEALRVPLRSPGRPGVAKREDRRQFWRAIAAGRASEDAGRDAGVAPAVGSRWFGEAGGMPPSHLASWARPLSGRYLAFNEREEIAWLARPGPRRAGDRASSGSLALDHLARATPECSDPQRRLGLSRDDRAMACGAGWPATTPGKVRTPCRSAPLCRGPSRRCDRPSRWPACAGTGRALVEAPPGPASASAVGQSLEPRADLGQTRGRLPRG